MMGTDKAVSIMGLRKIIAKALASSKWAKYRTTSIQVVAPTTAQVRVLRRLLVDSRLMQPAHATETTIGVKIRVKTKFCRRGILWSSILKWRLD